MAEELKLYIKDYKKTEKHIKKLGAVFDKQITAKDTYFNQPGKDVLKIVEDTRGNFFVRLKYNNKTNKFKILKYQKITNPKTRIKQLTKKLGLKGTIKKKRRFWKFQNCIINFCIVKNLGHFMIVEGKKLTKQIIKNKLKISHPKYVHMSFMDLKLKKK